MQLSDNSTLHRPSKNSYFLVVDGKPEGPFGLEELRARKIKPGDFVKCAGMDDYKEAHEVAELRDLLGFSKQPLIPQYFGSFDQRLMACALDWFFAGGSCILLAFFTTLFIENKTDRLSVALSTLALIPPVKIIYNIIMECTAKQATFGKQLLKIRVCDMQGNRISFFRSAGRNLAKICSAAPAFTGYLLAFFTKQQQCLHDIIAGTLVMKDRLF